MTRLDYETREIRMVVQCVQSQMVGAFAVLWVPLPRLGVGGLRTSNGFARPRKAVERGTRSSKS
jgi:hypothetical protein